MVDGHFTGGYSRVQVKLVHNLTILYLQGHIILVAEIQVTMTAAVEYILLIYSFYIPVITFIEDSLGFSQNLNLSIDFMSKLKVKSAI